mmetsp:Transcript_25769/g.61207  ORF Transcript_25769/g.61207 Transcript_25769/m.61207 type:complete len:451 (-) Transcript_25769:117-1469(-)
MPQINLGDVVPNFSADTSQGPVKFHEWISTPAGSWTCLFSHPADYTPVCTTELGTVALIQEEFTNRNCKVIALSCDDVTSHQGWIQDIKATQKVAEFNYPIISDPKREVAVAWGMVDPDEKDAKGLAMTCRAVFIIGPDKKLKLKLLYPASTGRNFAEIIRVLDSLQLTMYHSVATPADWSDGEPCMVLPSVSAADAATKFPNHKIVPTPSGKNYLRVTPQPNLNGMPKAPIKVHGLPMSASTLPVVATLAEAGLPYEVVVVNVMEGAHLKPEFKAMNPMHCIPTMEDSGFTMWEARAMAKYVCNSYKTPPNLYPQDVKLRSLCDMALDFHQGTYYPKVTAVVLYPIVGWAPPVDDAKLKEAEETFKADIWPAMQKIMKMAGGSVLGGAKVNIADFFFATHIQATVSKVPNSFVAKHDGLKKYLAAVKAQCPNWDKYMGGAVADFYAPAK